MNEALNIGPSNAFDVDYLSTLRRIRGEIPAANDDACVDLPAVDRIEAWACHASGTNGFGDAMVALPLTASRPTARELDQDARIARSQAIAENIATAVVSICVVLRRALASYRAYRDARETVWALRGLDDRTLRDLGYHRSEIESVAMEVSVARAR